MAGSVTPKKKAEIMAGSAISRKFSSLFLRYIAKTTAPSEKEWPITEARMKSWPSVVRLTRAIGTSDQWKPKMTRTIQKAETTTQPTIEPTTGRPKISWKKAESRFVSKVATGPITR